MKVSRLSDLGLEWFCYRFSFYVSYSLVKIVNVVIIYDK